MAIIKKFFRLFKSSKVFRLLFYFFLASSLLGAVHANVGNQDFQTWENYVYDKDKYDIRSFNTVTNNNFNIWLVEGTFGCFSDICDQTTGAANEIVNLAENLSDNPPASGVMYAMDTLHNFGLAPAAYAQSKEGVGFNSLQFVLPLWRAFRNIAYIIFVLVFVAMGFAIMFRQRISPQAVVTIQSSLPKIIVALLLVTFSYAIAGLMIDLSYVLYYVVIHSVENLGGMSANQATDSIVGYTQRGFLEVIGTVFNRGTSALIHIIGGINPFF